MLKRHPRINFPNSQIQKKGTLIKLTQTKYLKGSHLEKVMPPEDLNIVISLFHKFGIMDMVPPRHLQEVAYKIWSVMEVQL